MPIYEFHCAKCNRIFPFFSQTVASDKIPPCPKCGRSDMKKLMSKFALAGVERKSSKTTGKTSAADSPSTADAGVDDKMSDPRLQSEMMSLMEKAEGIDESNPRQMGAFLRRMCEVSGEKLTPGMTSAIQRLEAGEDMEKIEQDMGDEIESEMGGPGAMPGMGTPSYDDNVYSM